MWEKWGLKMRSSKNNGTVILRYDGGEYVSSHCVRRTEARTHAVVMEVLKALDEWKPDKIGATE